MRKTYDGWVNGPNQPRHSRPAGLGESALKGALAGMIGGAAMMMAMKLEQKALLPPSAQDTAQAAIPVLAHAVFGVATAGAFQALR